MSNLEEELAPSVHSMSQEEIDTFVEECCRFIQKSKNFSICTKETPAVNSKGVVIDSFVDALTDEEVEYIRKKMFSFWETAKTKRRQSSADSSTIKVTVLLQESEPITQGEEAVISFEDAKLEAKKVIPPTVTCYNMEQLIENELKELRNSKLFKDEGEESMASTSENKSSATMESMDFTEFEKKAAGLPGIAGIAMTCQQKVVPDLKSTDALEVLLHAYEHFRVDPTEKNDVPLYIGENEGQCIDRKREMADFLFYLVNEMKIIFERLATIYPLVMERSPETVDTSNSSLDNSNTKNSSSPKITPPGALQSTGDGYQELTGDSRSASGLLNVPVEDSARSHQPASKSSSCDGESSASNTNSLSEDTMSGVSSLPTDTNNRVSVSSMRSLDSLDVNPRTSTSNMMDDVKSVDNESLLSKNLQKAIQDDDLSGDAFLEENPVAPNAGAPNAGAPNAGAPNAGAPNPGAPNPGAQNPSRRRLASKEDDEDKSDEAKKPAI